MKPSFSFSDAVGAPFALLSRRPLYIFIWGLMMVALTVAIYALVAPMLLAMPIDGGSHETFEAYIEEVSRFSLAVNAINLVMYLLMLALWTAAGRAILTPGSGDRFLFLRLGMDEVRVAVVIVAVFVGCYIAMIIFGLLGLGIGLALWPSNETLAVVILIVYGLAALVVLIWASIRVSLIAPASLILRRFAFTEGWAVTKGQVWKLFGLNIVVMLIYVAAALLAYAIAGGILVAGFLGQGLHWPSEAASGADLLPVLRAMIVPAVLCILPLSFCYGFIMPLYAGPAVVAARQLLDGAPITQDAPLDRRLELP